MKKQLLALICLSSLLTGCFQPMSSVDTTNLNQIESLTAFNTPQKAGTGISNIRIKAVKETATTLGAQGGLANEAHKMNRTMKTNAKQLDKTFNFRPLILNHHVLPPVLVQANQLLNLANPETIRLADKTYRIVKQARFVTTAPNWREYLMMNYKKPDVPDQTLLPRTPAEQKIWIKCIRKGWKQGVAQAKTIYRDNLARLERDYKGMVLYRELLAQNIVSKPFVAETNLGVTANKSDSQLYINDKVLRITALPRLNPNTKKWKPVITHEQ